MSQYINIVGSHCSPCERGQMYRGNEGIELKVSRQSKNCNWERNHMRSKLFGTLLPKYGSQKKNSMHTCYLDFRKVLDSFSVAFPLFLELFHALL